MEAVRGWIWIFSGIAHFKLLVEQGLHVIKRCKECYKPFRGIIAEGNIA